MRCIHIAALFCSSRFGRGYHRRDVRLGTTLASVLARSLSHAGSMLLLQVVCVFVLVILICVCLPAADVVQREGRVQRVCSGLAAVLAPRCGRGGRRREGRGHTKILLGPFSSSRSRRGCGSHHSTARPPGGGALLLLQQLLLMQGGYVRECFHLAYINGLLLLRGE